MLNSNNLNPIHQDTHQGAQIYIHNTTSTVKTGKTQYQKFNFPAAFSILCGCTQLKTAVHSHALLFSEKLQFTHLV